MVNSPTLSQAQRSTLLSNTGRCFTLDKHINHRTLQRNQTTVTNVTKSLSNEKLRNKRLLLKGYSKKSTACPYDESFIRYVNELDSYFKASEIRHQNSRDLSEGTSQDYEDAESNRLPIRRKQYVWNQAPKSPAIPQISLNSFDLSVTDLDTLEVSMKTNSDNVSYYTTPTPDQDASFITAQDGQSLCLTPDQATTSDISCYLTAEQNSSIETDTYVYEIADDRGSQQTLYNDSFDYDDSIDSFDSYEVTSNELSCVHQLARIDLNADDEDTSCEPSISQPATNTFNDIKPQPMDTTEHSRSNSTILRSKLEAKERRSNFVRSMCIDLDDEIKTNNSSQDATVVVLDEPEPKKESYLKCCPV